MQQNDYIPFPDRVCDTCLFWWSFHKGDDPKGECRHKSPVCDLKARERSVEPYEWGAWPVTCSDDWCGDWKPMEFADKRREKVVDGILDGA